MSLSYDFMCDERLPVGAHEGPYRAFLSRHESEVARALSQGSEAMAEITPQLRQRIADPRNIRLAMGRVIQNGGVSGPDGLNCSRLASHEQWELCRAIKSCLQQGSYQHGPTRRVRIPKHSGTGHRELQIENHIDRIVARAVLQIIQPLIDPRFHDHSYGFRPGRDRRHALASALEQVVQCNTWWVVTDLQDAFDNIPVNRLLDIVRRLLPGDTTELIQRITRTKKKRGIRQGNPLSPLLMNIYLNHHLDGVWARKYPDTPLMRTADDILVCCRTQKRAQLVLDQLRQILLPTGMRLHHGKSAICNLSQESTSVDWLGYHVSMGNKGQEVRIAESAWTALGGKLEDCHRKVGAPLRASESLMGWLDQLGPCYPSEDIHAVYLRAMSLAEEQAFTELPEEHHVQTRWHQAYQRWCSLRSPTSYSYCSGVNGGSACQSFFSRSGKPRSDGASRGAPSLSFSATQSITLYTDGCCDQQSSCGGWAAILESDCFTTPIRIHGGLRRTTNNRAELTAVIKGLQRTPVDAHVHLVSDSRYVVGGINGWLRKWKRQGWRAGSGRHKRALQNQDLWQRLDVLLATRKVTAGWVRGHTGHPRNEECDHLANQAMQSLLHQG